MIEGYLNNYIEEFSDIILSFDKLEITKEEDVWRLKARLNLFDGSSLWIREIRENNKIDAYSYYWLRPDDSLIVGWDNAPHHKSVKSFPHHRHIRGAVEPSCEKSLEDVLLYIRKFVFP